MPFNPLAKKGFDKVGISLADLPPALGALEVADTDSVNLTLTGNTLTAEVLSSYTLPTASTTVLGGIKVGPRLSITDGVLSADATDLSAYSTKLQADALYAPISITQYTDAMAVAAVGMPWTGMGYYIGDGSAFATAAQGSLADTALQSETDPVFTAWDKSTGISITESQISDFGTYLTAESDPAFNAWLSSTPPAYPGDIPTTLPASDVYDWAKAATKPTYTYSEVGAQVAGTYSTDIHANITALDLVSGENTGDQTLPTRDSLGLDTDDAVQFARVGFGVAPDANRVFYSAATTGASLPLFERPSLTTNDPITCVYFLSTKTTDMGDGFGITNAFQIKDNAGVANTIGVIGFVRAGADNSGDFVVRPHVAGTQTEKLRVAASGAITAPGTMSAAGGFLVGATAGVDGTFTAGTKTVTVTKGIITNIV